MSILVNSETKLVVQGITGKEGSFHATRCKNYGTNLVAGVTPGQGGNMFDKTVPIFDTVEEAVFKTGANTSLIFVPAPFAIEAISESIDSGISFGKSWSEIASAFSESGWEIMSTSPIRVHRSLARLLIHAERK